MPLKVYDESIGFLRRALDAAKLGHGEKLDGFARLDTFARLVEDRCRHTPTSTRRSRTSGRCRDRSADERCLTTRGRAARGQRRVLHSWNYSRRANAPERAAWAPSVALTHNYCSELLYFSLSVQKCSNSSVSASNLCGWGVYTSTAEARMKQWISFAMVVVGVGLVVLGFADYVPAG